MKASNTTHRSRVDRLVPHSLAAFICLVGALTALAETPAPINPASPEPPTGAKDAFAQVKIWFHEGNWHVTWGGDSSIQGPKKKGVRRPWIGIIEVLDGERLNADSRGLDASGKKAKVVDRVRVVGKQIRFSSTTTGGLDKLEFTTDATQVRFTIMQGDSLEDAIPVPPSRIFVGARSRNPTTMPFVLEHKARGK